MNTIIAIATNTDIWQILQPLGITTIDPFLLSIFAGLIWPPIQAIFDQPFWTKERRTWLALAAAGVLAAVVWVAGHYPLAWEMLVTQAGIIFLNLTIAFRILKALGVIDWIGRVTPGGEAKPAARHLASEG